MTPSLHRIVYVSRNLMLRCDAADVEPVVAASVERNGRVGVTGLLLVHAGTFVQALEGGHRQVMETYGRILRDKRHDQCRLLSAEPAAERLFGDWAMCARRLSADDRAILETLALRQDFDPARLTGPTALKLLQAVRRIQTTRVAA